MIAAFAVLALSLVSTGSTPASAVGPFRTTTVVGGGLAGGRTSMALSPGTGYPVIAYFDELNNDLELAVCLDAACAATTLTSIDADGDMDGEFLSMKLSTLGYPVISYSSDGVLELVVCHDPTCTSPAPTFTTVAGVGDGARPSSLDLNSDGYPVISYSSDSTMQLAVCHDATCTSPVPTVRTIADVAGFLPSLDLTGLDFPVITYIDSFTGFLMLAACADVTCAGFVATPTAVDEAAPSIFNASMVLNFDDIPVISYSTAGRLWVATCDDLSCPGPAIEEIGTGLVQTTSLGVNLSGFPVISYYDTDAHQLMVAVCNDAICENSTRTVVDSFPSSANGNSLVIDERGNPVIAASDDNADSVTVHLVPATSEVVSVYAGAETDGTPLLPVDPQGTGPMANQAHLGWPTNMAFDVDGNMYFTDRFNHTVRRIDADGTQVFYVAGQPGERCIDPTSGCGDEGLAVDAHLSSPWGIAVDNLSPPNIYVSDYGNHKIRKILAQDGIPDNGIDGTISTIAGTGFAGYNEDGIPAVDAQLNFPSGLTIDADGAVLVADRGNHRIRRISTTGVDAGIITTFLGTGEPNETADNCTATGDAACMLFEPSDIKMRGSSAIPSVPSNTDFFIALRASDTVLVTRAGGDDGVIADRIADAGIGARAPRSGVGLSRPLSLAYDALHQQLYIADSGHMQIQRLSMVSLDTVTVAGNGQGRIGGGDYVAPTDGPALDTAINFPIGVAFRPSGGQSQGTAFYTGVYENQIRRLAISEDGIL